MLVLDLVPIGPKGAAFTFGWLAPEGEFILMLRLYWPKDEAVNGAWAPPPIRRMD